MSFSRARQNTAKGYSGVTKLRKTLRRIDPELTKGIKKAITKGAEQVHFDIVLGAQSHRLTGDMIESISVKYGRDNMTAVIGPGAKWVSVNKSPFNTSLITEKNAWGAWQFFKAYWIEFGTKGSPDLNIPPQPSQPFVGPAWDSNKPWLIKECRAAVEYALVVASYE